MELCGEMGRVDVLCDPQGISGDGQARVEAGARREERGVHHIEVVDFVGTVLRIKHAAGGVGAKSARTAHVSKGLVVVGLAQGQRAEGLQHLIEVAQEHLAAFDLARVDAILKPQSLAPVETWLVAREDSIVEIWQVLHHRDKHQCATDHLVVDGPRSALISRSALDVHRGWFINMSRGANEAIEAADCTVPYFWPSMK